MSDNDFYGIEEDWKLLVELVNKSDKDIKYFTSPKRGKNASVRARNNLNEIRKLCVEIRGKILRQRQDNDSDYY